MSNTDSKRTEPSNYLLAHTTFSSLAMEYAKRFNDPILKNFERIFQISTIEDLLEPIQQAKNSSRFLEELSMENQCVSNLLQYYFHRACDAMSLLKDPQQKVSRENLKIPAPQDSLGILDLKKHLAEPWAFAAYRTAMHLAAAPSLQERATSPQDVHLVIEKFILKCKKGQLFINTLEGDVIKQSLSHVSPALKAASQESMTITQEKHYDPCQYSYADSGIGMALLLEQSIGNSPV